MYGNVRGNQVKCLNGCGHCIQKKSGIVICHCINMWEGGIRLPESIWKYFWYNIHELLKHGCCISFYFMGTFCELWVRKPAWQRKEGASVKSIQQMQTHRIQQMQIRQQTQKVQRQNILWPSQPMIMMEMKSKQPMKRHRRKFLLYIREALKPCLHLAWKTVW